MAQTVRAKYILFVVISLFFLTGAGIDPEHDAVLTSVESFFKSLKNRDYQNTWSCLTLKSKTRIVEDTYKAIVKYNREKKRDLEVTPEQILKDFESEGPIAKEYWGAFLANFNPDTVLEESRWELGRVDKAKAELIVQYKGSERPAILQVFKEDGRWRFGLMETFSTWMR